jgi:hypothetical protein
MNMIDLGLQLLQSFAKRVELVAQSSLESFKIKIIQEKENIAITGTGPE